MGRKTPVRSDEKFWGKTYQLWDVTYPRCGSQAENELSGRSVKLRGGGF